MEMIETLRTIYKLHIKGLHADEIAEVLSNTDFRYKVSTIVAYLNTAKEMNKSGILFATNAAAILKQQQKEANDIAKAKRAAKRKAKYNAKTHLEPIGITLINGIQPLAVPNSHSHLRGIKRLIPLMDHLVERYNAGESSVQLAKFYNVDASALVYQLKKHGAKMRTHKESAQRGETHWRNRIKE